jgi:hypothetical protein
MRRKNKIPLSSLHPEPTTVGRRGGFFNTGAPQEATLQTNLTLQATLQTNLRVAASSMMLESSRYDDFNLLRALCWISG